MKEQKPTDFSPVNLLVSYAVSVRLDRPSKLNQHAVKL